MKIIVKSGIKMRVVMRFGGKDWGNIDVVCEFERERIKLVKIWVLKNFNSMDWIVG